jgi:phospholipid/cholesterol/gamma-HCH transport system substrate-binding protein
MVGAFVIVLCTAMILAIIWLSSGFALGEYTVYKVYMQESVSGLTTDSAVEFNGVDVGTVKHIKINRHDPKLVELLLNVKTGTPITQGTVATLSSRGLTGITYIALKDNGSDLRKLVTVGSQTHPVIKSGPSLFNRLDKALSDVSTNLSKVATAIESILDKENQRSFKDILRHLDILTGTLAADSDKLNIIIQNTERASLRFEPLLRSWTKGMDVFQTQTLPSTYQLLNSLNEMTRSLSEITAQIKQNPSVLIRGTSNKAKGPGEQ